MGDFHHHLLLGLWICIHFVWILICVQLFYQCISGSSCFFNVDPDPALKKLISVVEKNHTKRLQKSIKNMDLVEIYIKKYNYYQIHCISSAVIF